MSYYIPSGQCGDEVNVPRYACTDCGERDFARVRHVAYFDENYEFSDIESFAEWNTLLNAGQAEVIRNVLGSYDGGETEEIGGFGDVEFDNGNTTHVLTFKDPNYKDNRDFYNALKNKKDKKFVWTTQNNMFVANTPANISVKIPIAESIKDIVVAEVTIKWVQSDLPLIYTRATDLFDECRIYTAV